MPLVRSRGRDLSWIGRETFTKRCGGGGDGDGGVVVVVRVWCGGGGGEGDIFNVAKKVKNKYLSPSRF